MSTVVRALLLLLSLSVVLGVAAPGSARADGAVTLVSGELRFSSDSQDAENLVISRGTNALNCNPLPFPCLQLANGPQRIRDQVATTACEQLLFNGQPFDTIVVCALNAGTRLRVTLNDGDDFAEVGAGIVPTTLDGGTGNDNLSSDSGSDTLIGGAEDDVLSDDGTSGNDAVDGGAGNDSISISGGNDDVTGGAGDDTVLMDDRDDTVRLDGLANDGPPGATTNIRPDVEVIDGGAGSDNLFGNAAGEHAARRLGQRPARRWRRAGCARGRHAARTTSPAEPTQDRVVYSDTAAQTITLDGVRDDGAAGELDNVRSGHRGRRRRARQRHRGGQRRRQRARRRRRR